MKKIFIDTEFTDFENKGLISIGFSDLDSDDCFYVEFSDFNKDWASEFVEDNIYPLLDHSKYGKPREKAIEDATNWLSSKGACVLVGDWLGDWTILKKNVNFPDNVEGFILVEEFFVHLFDLKHIEDVREKMDEFSLYCSKYYQINHARVHHALDDALANKWAFMQVVEKTR